MKISLETPDGDFLENMEGKRFYPNLSEDSLILLEQILVRSKVKSLEILKTVQCEESEIPCNRRKDRVLGMSELVLITARLKKAGMDYREVLGILVPDYEKKIETLCGSTLNLEFIPSTAVDHEGHWSAYSKVLFRSTEDLSSEDLTSRIESVGVHGLQYFPPYVNELGMLYTIYGDKLPLPVFTPVSPEKNNEKRVSGWHTVGAENMLQDKEGLWKKGIAPAGTSFAGMCEEAFWVSTLEEIRSGKS